LLQPSRSAAVYSTPRRSREQSEQNAEPSVMCVVTTLYVSSLRISNGQPEAWR
jgi:hypothetical protein